MKPIDMTTIWPFHVYPDEIAWRLRESWLEHANNNGSPIIETLIPYLEMEAIFRLKMEMPNLKDESPPLKDGFEAMRLWWLNEALQNCDSHNPIGKAGNHLSVIGQAAVNVLIAASELRDAIHYKHAEKSVALGMLLICEAIAGGYWIELSALRTARENAYENGIGLESNDFHIARTASIKIAKQIWEEKPNLRIGEVVEEILSAIKTNASKFPSLEAFPKEKTIKTWLKEAAKAGRLAMPAGAQRRGRPPKEE